MEPIRRWAVRLAPALVLLVVALVLNDQGTRRSPDVDPRDVTVVEGTVTAFDSIKALDRTSNRVRNIVIYTVALAEYPANVTFRLNPPPPEGVPVGSHVRLEAIGADSALDRAGRYPDVAYRIDTAGLAVDGQTAYTAADRAERANDIASGYRVAAAVCLLLAAAWAALQLMLWRRTTYNPEPPQPAPYDPR